MANKQKDTVAFSDRMDVIQRQFKNLDTKDPSVWPIAPKVLLCVFIAIAVATVLWFAFLQDYEVELEGERTKEVTLRADYQKKLVKAVSTGKASYHFIEADFPS